LIIKGIKIGLIVGIVLRITMQSCKSAEKLYVWNGLVENLEATFDEGKIPLSIILN
jgi:hypothetical protein